MRSASPHGCHETRPAMTPPPHLFTCRVYYEDTDFGGIVYYANYLKFIERARSEWVRDLGLDQRRMKAEAGVVFAVRRVEADFLRPAFLDDLLTVSTRPERIAGASATLWQQIARGAETIFTARVVLVALGPGGPVRLPEALRRPAP